MAQAQTIPPEAPSKDDTLEMREALKEKKDLLAYAATVRANHTVKQHILVKSRPAKAG